MINNIEIMSVLYFFSLRPSTKWSMDQYWSAAQGLVFTGPSNLAQSKLRHLSKVPFFSPFHPWMLLLNVWQTFKHRIVCFCVKLVSFFSSKSGKLWRFDDTPNGSSLKHMSNPPPATRRNQIQEGKTLSSHMWLGYQRNWKDLPQPQHPSQLQSREHLEAKTGPPEGQNSQTQPERHGVCR